MFKRLMEWFFMPWMIILGLFLTFCAFSGFRFSANLDGVTQFFALHPHSLHIIGLILLIVGLSFAGFFLVATLVERGIRYFLKSPMGLRATRHLESCSTKKKWIILVPTGIAAVFALRFILHVCLLPPAAHNTHDAIQTVHDTHEMIQSVRGTPVLFEMRIPVPASVIAQEERQEAAQRKQAQAKDLPPPPIFRVWTKTIHGRARVTQIGPDTYQIKMLHHAR
ncbi:hypothetical protein HER14_04755 [Acidithiobacillus thiooxidans]|uniref:hypothetical protein n=1 Tax=Acidithiobacillus thiooxidans TaxID=930 RepID=UPI001C06F725|nr:hypothetical protein [Acidithiobacillus thiooxidans]MBU2750265.1 hypothetical protein [Acidithiobacillus thiooxidans]